MEARDSFNLVDHDGSDRHIDSARADERLNEPSAALDACVGLRKRFAELIDVLLEIPGNFNMPAISCEQVMKVQGLLLPPFELRRLDREHRLAENTSLNHRARVQSDCPGAVIERVIKRRIGLNFQRLGPHSRLLDIAQIHAVPRFGVGRMRADEDSAVTH